MKIAESLERQIEAILGDPPQDLPVGEAIGRAEPLERAVDRYVAHLLSTIQGPLTGLRIVLDGAFGAAWDAAPRAFRETGAEVIAMNCEPDGSRINVKCGSTFLEPIRERVLEEGADAGFAFDGDADRVLAIDERGEVVDGDRIIAMYAVDLHERDELTNNVVVSTVMANLGFRRALETRGIEVVTVPVGDKNVADEMATSGALVGGEQSGHVIFGAHSTTGDGVLTALQVARMLATSDSTLSRLAHFFEPYPQVLINVKVGSKDQLPFADELWAEVRAAEAALGDEGRVLVRPSGTEPLVRVMVEAPDHATAERTAEALAAAVRRYLSPAR
jgi:phosphoglucosamine mutase